MESWSHPFELDPAGGFLVLLSCGLPLFTHQWVQWWIFVMAILLCAASCEGQWRNRLFLGEVWQQPLSALHTNSPQTQPTPCLSTQLTDYISVSSSEFASRVSGLLWDLLHWTLSYPRRKGSKHLILILQTFDFWLSLKVDWMKLVIPLLFQEAINCTAVTRTTCHSFFNCCGSIVPKCSFYLRGARVSAKNV